MAEEIAFFDPALPARLLPDWGCLPYDQTSPSAATQGARLAALSALQTRGGITVAAAPSALLPCPPPSFVAARVFNFRVGDFADLPLLASSLAANGYARVNRVLAPGEFAIYGGQMDIFSPDVESPVRLVLAEDKIEQIRKFDPRSQRTVAKMESLRAMPSGECDLSPPAVARFKKAFVARFGSGDAMLKSIAAGQAAAGMECMLPLFFERVGRLLDYAPPPTVIFMHADGEDSLARFMQQARRRQKLASVYEHRPTLPANELFWTPEELHSAAAKFSRVELGEADENTRPPEAAINPRLADSHAALIKLLRGENKVMLAVGSEGRRDSLSAALTGGGLELQRAESFADAVASRLSLTVAPLRAGFVGDGLTALTEAEMFDIRLPPRRHRPPPPPSDFADLTVGGMVAHRDYGIGKYLGMAFRDLGGQRGEFLQIEYAEGKKLWVPSAHLHLLSPHDGEAPALSRLGGGQWKRARARAEKNARDIAARMLELNARRLRSGGRAHVADEKAMARFAAGFPFEETPDQITAAQATLEDMRAAKPMDRLIAADVGFGKTEIAMRAACAALLAGVQTAVLTPTTLLAEQHARNFADRFSGFNANIALLTRLSSPREKKRAREAAASGEARILIGAHALLQPSMRYKELGLAIIDEEHRFGVRQKEYFKTLRADLDILSLSATPIPRTLAMALEGIRDISIMSMPPPSRLAVQTSVAPFSRGLIIDACERELLRGGQIYFVHNEIRTLAAMEEQLREWIPPMRIAVAHGGMEAAMMEQAMRRFVRRDADMLLCTTIVESGLDIANANTMIINRADRMGVSRLHQLRGRVGRSGAQAHALLLHPGEEAMTSSGKKRLAAVAENNSLGGGLLLAMRDLEARGAGEVLGEKQSGDIAAVGFAMYQKMLRRAAKRLSGDAPSADIETVVELQSPALLPSDYVDSPDERLVYYRQLAACDSADEIDNVGLEWEDRFGSPPPPAQLLLASHRLRLQAAAAGATSVRASGDSAIITFVGGANSPTRAALLQKIQDGVCRPLPDDKVSLENIGDSPLPAAAQISAFLRAVAPKQN